MSKTLALFGSDMDKLATELRQFIDSKAPIIAGVELTQGFKQSFDKQGFNDLGASTWSEVERRKGGSKWFGHGSKTGAAKSRGILVGSGALRDSIRYEASAHRVRIVSNKVYAAVHNEGLSAKIYGKTSFQMPKRQFMGNSTLILNRIERKLDKELRKLITKK